jgi:putative SbcD/Mre11-related phosphoesterase
MVKIQPLWDAPALQVDSWLVVCDIHLGFEYEMYKKGIRMGSLTERIKDSIEKLLAENVEKVVFLGDIKHNIPNISWQEEIELPYFLNIDREIELVKGNHDGGIESLVDMDVKQEIILDDVTFTHGHRGLDAENLPPLLVVGHSHPAIEFEDELGSRMKEKCWVFGKTVKNTKVIIMPAFNPVMSGMALNRDPKIPGALFSQKLLDRSECDIFLLDGTYLGRLNKL